MDPGFSPAVPVSEKDLRDFTKSLNISRERSIAIAQGKIQEATIAIVETASGPDITALHLSAAINALCSVFQTQETAYSTPLGMSLWENGIWLRCFLIFLDRSSSTKGKSMRKFLGCLVSLLREIEPSIKESILHDALGAIFYHVLQQANHGKTKPAIYALGIFLSKEVLYLELLLCAFDKADTHENVSPRKRDRGQQVQAIFNVLFYWVQFAELAPAAGHTACTFSRQLRNSSSGDQYDTESADLGTLWINPLRDALRTFPDSLSIFRSHVFPDLFSLSVPDYYTFLLSLDLHAQMSPDGVSGQHKFDNRAEFDSNILFLALQAGKETGLIADSDDPDLGIARLHGNIIEIRVAAFRNLLISNSGPARLAGLSLLTSAVPTARPLSVDCLKALRQALPLLMIETEPAVRGEIVSLFQRLIDRLKAATFNLHKVSTGKPLYVTKRDDRTIKTPMNSNDAAKRLKAHQDFLRWLVQFLFIELQPGASYQRHISSLRFFTILIESGLDRSINRLSNRGNSDSALQWGMHIGIIAPDLARAFQDLVLDPFEDVRSRAAFLLEVSLLAQQPTDQVAEKSKLDYLFIFLKSAELRMSQSGRADHADGVSRIYLILFRIAPNKFGDADNTQDRWCRTKAGIIQCLLEKLDIVLSMAQSNMSLAMSRYPMHGIISSLKYVFDSPGIYDSLRDEAPEVQDLWTSFHQRIFAALETVWNCVRDLLCNDAPEGYVPEDLEDEVSLTTKDILSYSWRALKEASSLVQVLAHKSTLLTESAFGVLSEDDLDNLTRLNFTALTELRHRGAFSAVAQAFSACCARHHQEGRTDALLTLYGDTMRHIKDRGSSITRRSAGLPSLMTGILSANPGSALFERAMENLLDQAKPDTGEIQEHGEPIPQVHALNCLRAIFTSAALGPCSEKFVANGLDLAGKCLMSDLWPIRNCGLMLFRALIDRTLGSNDSNDSLTNSPKKLGSFTYSNYPSMLQIIGRLLETPDEQLHSPSAAIDCVFPALKIIQRALPPDDVLNELRSSVLRLCGSSHWHVRDMAARTFSMLIPEGDYVTVIRDLLDQKVSKQNQIHGYLMCVLHLIRRKAPNLSDSFQQFCYDVAATLDVTIDSLYVANPCPFTQTAFVDLHNYMLQVTIKIPLLRANLCIASAEKLIRPVTSSGSPTTGSDPGFVHPPMLQKSIALLQILVFISKMASSESQSTPTSIVPDFELLISELARQDANACSWAFSELEETTLELSSTVSGHLANALYKLMCSPSGSNVHLASQRLLVQVLENKHAGILLGSDSPFLSIKSVLLGLEAKPPSQIETGIRLWSMLLNQTCDTCSWSRELAKEVHLLMRTIHPLLDDSHPFSLRYMAVLALKDLSHVWSLPESAFAFRKLRLAAILLVYDCLNDDDEEIREVAAEIASRALQPSYQTYPRKPIIPIVASQKLAGLMTTSFPESSSLFFEAVKRLTGVKRRNKDGELLPSASRSFENSSREETALFIIERQNLYIDDVREAMLWSAVARRLSPRAAKCGTLRALSSWAHSALSKLLSKTRDFDNKALSWPSTPKAFVFGMRAVCAADVVLHWTTIMESRNSHDGLEGAGGSAMLEQLAELVISGEQNGLHGVLLRRAEKVLQRAVIARFKAAGQQVGSLEKQLTAAKVS